MTLNEFDQTDEELLDNAKESLVRIISYWRRRAIAAEAKLEDIMEEQDDLYTPRSDWDEWETNESPWQISLLGVYYNNEINEVKTCPNCLGEGIVRLSTYLDEIICWECNGSGEIEDGEKKWIMFVLLLVL